MPTVVIVAGESVTVSSDAVSDTVIVADTTVEVVEVITEGPQGLQGPPGEDAGESHQHTQSVASASWVITHGFGRLVHVTLLDPSGELVEADVVESSPDVVSVSFPAPVTGSAFIS